MTCPLEGFDYFIYLRELPEGIYACVATNPDGTFTIWLDPRRSYDQLRKDLDHEIKHIIENDFYNGLPIQKVEAS